VELVGFRKNVIIIEIKAAIDEKFKEFFISRNKQMKTETRLIVYSLQGEQQVESWQYRTSYTPRRSDVNVTASPTSCYLIA